MAAQVVAGVSGNSNEAAGWRLASDHGEGQCRQPNAAFSESWGEMRGQENLMASPATKVEESESPATTEEVKMATAAHHAASTMAIDVTIAEPANGGSAIVDRGSTSGSNSCSRFSRKDVSSGASDIATGEVSTALKEKHAREEEEREEVEERTMRNARAREDSNVIKSSRYGLQRERALATEILLSSHIKPVDLMSAEILPPDEESEESALWKLKRRIRLKLLEAEAGGQGGGSTAKDLAVATTAVITTTVTDGRSHEPRLNSKNSSGGTPDSHIRPSVAQEGSDHHPRSNTRISDLGKNGSERISATVSPAPFVQSPPPQQQEHQPDQGGKPLVKVKRRTIMDISSSEDEKDVSNSDPAVVRINATSNLEEPRREEQQQQKNQESHQISKDSSLLQQHHLKLRRDREQEETQTFTPFFPKKEQEEMDLIKAQAAGAGADCKQQTTRFGFKELPANRRGSLNAYTQANGDRLERPSELFSKNSIGKSSGGSEDPGSISALPAVRKTEDVDEEGAALQGTRQNSTCISALDPGTRKRQASPGETVVQEVKKKPRGRPKGSVTKNYKVKPGKKPKCGASKGKEVISKLLLAGRMEDMTEYEIQRVSNVRHNQMVLERLQLGAAPASSNSKEKARDSCLSASEYSDVRESDQDEEENDFSSGGAGRGHSGSCERRIEKESDQFQRKRQQHQYEDDVEIEQGEDEDEEDLEEDAEDDEEDGLEDDEDGDEEEEAEEFEDQDLNRRSREIRRVLGSGRSALECDTISSRQILKSRKGYQQHHQQQHSMTLQREVQEKPKGKAPRGRPRKHNLEKPSADSKNAGSQINQTLLKLLFELVKSGGGDSLGSIAQDILKLENSSILAGEQNQKRAGGSGRGRRSSNPKSPKAKPTGRPKKSNDNSSTVWERNGTTAREKNTSSSSGPFSSSSARTLVSQRSSQGRGRGRRRKESWLTAIPYDTPKCEYEMKRDENLRSHNGELERLGVVLKDLVEAAPKPSRQTRTYQKRWGVKPNPEFVRQTRLQVKSSTVNSDNNPKNNNSSSSNGKELPIKVKREIEESNSGPNVSSEADDMVEFDGFLAPEPDHVYSAVADFMEAARLQLQDHMPPPPGELDWKHEDMYSFSGVGAGSSRRVVSFHSELGRQQLQDPLLARVYTLDVGRLSGQQRGLQLLAAGGTQGRISVFGIPPYARESAAELRRAAGSNVDKGAAAVNSEAGGAAGGAAAFVTNSKGPLLSWAVEGSWISQVLFLPTRFQENQMLLLSSSNDGRVVLWDINQVRSRDGIRQLTNQGTPRVVSQTNTLHTGCIFGMHELDGRMATAAEECVGISVIRETVIFMERFIANHHTGTIRNVKFRDSNVLADCGTDMVIGILDLRCPEPCALKIPTAHKTGMSLVEWSPCSEHVLLSASLDPQLYLHDIRSPGLYQHILHGHVHPRRAKCYSVYRPVFVDGGSLVVSPGEGTHQLTLYSTKTGALMGSVPVGYDNTIMHWSGQNLWAACTHITKFTPMWGSSASDQQLQQQNLRDQIQRSHHSMSSSHRGAFNSKIQGPSPT